MRGFARLILDQIIIDRFAVFRHLDDILAALGFVKFALAQTMLPVIVMSLPAASASRRDVPDASNSPKKAVRISLVFFMV